ncbi:hypothetical protein FA95DRAFT_1612909 [Auriscalpium vulgare]|uniref:Uncharacterized protein n=1 Tax=Auriscalpium vulgare TaxID=40419 RepID=A0ACB8R560_9AGAM|nr:hypothetical protein FA95DRAFT_1612909 [Auriscalpium vulgare]
MESRIRFNVEVAPGRVVVLTLAVSPAREIAVYAAQHRVPNPGLSAWRPSLHCNPQPAAQDELTAAAAAAGTVRKIEVALNVAGGEGGWSEITIEEGFE